MEVGKEGRTQKGRESRKEKMKCLSASSETGLLFKCSSSGLSRAWLIATDTGLNSIPYKALKATGGQPHSLAGILLLSPPLSFSPFPP